MHAQNEVLHLTSQERVSPKDPSNGNVPHHVSHRQEARRAYTSRKVVITNKATVKAKRRGQKKLKVELTNLLINNVRRKYLIVLWMELFEKN